MAMAGVSPDPVAHRIVEALRIEREWTVSEGDAAGFVAGELGTWLMVKPSAAGTPILRIEVRLAGDVPDAPATWRFLDACNNTALIGRWVHDSSAGVVALVADLPLGESMPLAYAREALAQMVGTAETLAYLSAPQRELQAGKALTLVGGRRRESCHPVAGHLRQKVYPAGTSEQVPGRLLPQVQDQLPSALPGWSIDQEARGSVAKAADGSRLLAGLAQHPTAGWGVIVSLGGENYVCDEADGPVYAAALNAGESVLSIVTPGPGCWTACGAALEYRVFLTAALLAADEAVGAAPEFVTTVVQLVAAHADTMLLDREANPTDGLVVERPTWPGDAEAHVLARRDPINDGLDDEAVLANDGLARATYVDGLERACTITDESFDRWRSRLVPEDLGDEKVSAFIRFGEERFAGRHQHR